MQIGRTYDEKRDFMRVKMGCEASIAEVGGAGWNSAMCVNLSASGVLVESLQDYPLGARIMLQVEPKLQISQGLFAEVEVVRKEYDDFSKKYHLGGKIVEIHQ